MNLNWHFHFDGIRFFIRQSLHTDGCQPGSNNIDGPVHACFTIGSHGDCLSGFVEQFQMPAFVFNHYLNRLFRLQVVVDNRGQHDLVTLGEESRGLRSNDQIFAADNVRGSRANSSSIAHRPGFDLPRGQIIRNLKLHFDDPAFVSG